ncbi:MAG: YlxR family protein [Chloroflexi bacterium]|nr:MAG: YlxR family protein [Chloroflexota bacterium]
MRIRRVPERTCVACRETAGKRELVRVVRTVAGPVEVDLTGRKNGRGAYLHADPVCWDMAFKRQTLNGALKTVVGGDDLTALQEFRDRLVAGDAGVAAVPVAAVAARVATGTPTTRGSRRQGRGGGVKPATAKPGPVGGGRA